MTVHANRLSEHVPKGLETAIGTSALVIPLCSSTRCTEKYGVIAERRQEALRNFLPTIEYPGRVNAGEDQVG